MQRYIYKFDFSELKIDPHHIGRLLDYNKGEDREMIAAIIDDVLNMASEACDIRAEFIVYNRVVCDKNAGVVKINDIEFHTGRIIAGQIRNAGSVAVFACTAGNWIEKKVHELMNGNDLLRGYVLDIAGSEIVEAAADEMQKNLSNLLKEEGLRITNRYSPGYCGWNVSEQHKLFSLLPDNYCGITLTDSALMTPIKSVSGIIGIGQSVKYNPYTCSICDQKDCIYRRIKERH